MLASIEKRAGTTLEQAWKMILKGTRQLPIGYKDVKLYRKNGGFEQALTDFKSLGPDHVQSSNYEKFGRHGNNEIYLRGRSMMTETGPTIEAILTVITKQNLESKPHRVTKIIQYLSGGSN